MRVKVFTKKSGGQVYEGILDGHDSNQISLFIEGYGVNVVIPWNNIDKVSMIDIEPDRALNILNGEVAMYNPGGR